ncbi:membrane-associating domain-containing protein [Massariosphaeria phaeospora]|uniref:Membrane-associating domain-containing protein n=1 Tax=Massariosphaeria phaeospora TaxID=100035 RepID=A0A7C8M8A3_9PLEO|nr:membrane-associating domain-containing protein [Massariosphaeria phaeospora]
MFFEGFVLPLRAVQALFSIIVLGLTAYLVDASWWTPDSVNFMLFTSVWTLLAVAYLVLAPSRFPAAAHKYAIAGVEALTMIFWFAAWVAVASLWGDFSCTGHSAWCSSGTAAIVFAAFTWATFVATTIIAALHIRRTSSNDTAPPPQMQGV